MPRPLRVPDESERNQLEQIRTHTRQIQDNLRRNVDLAKDRRDLIRQLVTAGWSMYGIGLETGISPNTVRRILDND